MERVNSSNQGESSTQDNVLKKPVLMPVVANAAGAQSGVSETAGRGASPIAVDMHTTIGINPGASSENRSAKFKNPNVKASAGEFGSNQYE